MFPLTRHEFPKLVGASGTAALALLADQQTAKRFVSPLIADLHHRASESLRKFARFLKKTLTAALQITDSEV